MEGNRPNPLLALYPAQPAVYVGVKSSDGIAKTAYCNPALSSSSVAGTRLWAGSAALSGDAAPSGLANGGVWMTTNYGATGQVFATAGVAGSNADVIVNSMTGASMTQVTNFSLKALAGPPGMILSVAARNKIADALMTSGANGYNFSVSGGGAKVRLFSGAFPTYLSGISGYAGATYLAEFPGGLVFPAAAGGAIVVDVSGATAMTTAATGTAAWALLYDGQSGTPVLAATVGITGTEGIVLDSINIDGTARTMITFNITLP